MEKDWKLSAMKEACCNLMMMTNYGSLACHDDARINSRVNNDATFEFKCSKVIDNHRRNRGHVDDHNDKWHYSGNCWGMRLEKSWNTTRWAIRSFCFVIDVIETNYFIACRYFTNSNLDLLQFRRGLIKMLLNNNFDESFVSARVSSVNTRSNSNCELINRLSYSKCVD